MKRQEQGQPPTRRDHLDENELAQYVDFLRDGTPPLPQDLEDHVAGCGYCRAEIMSMTDLLDTLPEQLDMPGMVEEPAPSGHGYRPDPKGMARPVPWILLRNAAAVAAVVFLAWMVQRYWPERAPNEPIASQMGIDSLPAAESSEDTLPREHPDADPRHSASASLAGNGTLPDTVRYAEAFIPNPAYESLVGAKYRAGNDPLVKGPEPATRFHPGDTLSWTWTPDPDDRYTITIIDNKARQVAEVPLAGGSSCKWKINLGPGLYYWKFMGKDELWSVGRLEVRNAPVGR